MDSETQKTDALYEFLAWLEVNKKRVAIGGGAVLVLAGLIATVVWYRGQAELKASEALSAIRVPANPSEPLPPDTLDNLQKFIAGHSGTAAAKRAELIRAGLLFTTGQYADAQGAFEKFIQQHAESPWISEAYYGSAVCLDALGKTNEAVAKYEDFARRFSTDPKIDQARFHLATLLESANRPADAVREYDRIVKATSYSPSQGEAQDRLRKLLVKYPHLAPTNAPSPSLTNAPLVTPALPKAAATGAVGVVKTNLAAATNLLKLTPTTNPPAAPKAK